MDELLVGIGDVVDVYGSGRYVWMCVGVREGCMTWLPLCGYDFPGETREQFLMEGEDVFRVPVHSSAEIPRLLNR